MFPADERSNPSAITAMANPLEWIDQQIERCKAEIIEQELAIKSREPVIAQQNFDLQDAFSRYISLSRKQCEKQTNELMSQTAEELTERRTLQLESKVATAAFVCDDIEKSISELKQSAETAENSLSKMNAIASAIANNGKQLMDEIIRSKTSNIAASTSHPLLERTTSVTKQKVEASEQILDKLTKKNRTKAELANQLQELKQDFIIRIERLSQAVGIMGDHITTASRQVPRPQLSLQTNNIVSIEPLSKRTRGADNLVIMAPISTRRSVRSDSMFFGSRSFFTHRPRF